MFSTSTQRKYWLFKSRDELNRLREEANQNFMKKYGLSVSEESRPSHFLTADEERFLCKKYEGWLRDFCHKFKPPMPACVIGTSLNYFKRFYLYNSVMDYHPKEILVTCAYLATKVEEFNVSISQFVKNIKGDREKAMDVILNNELLLMQQLNYHLTIHNPYRPVEGFLIDIKTRCQLLKEPERLRPLIEDFLSRCSFTDAALLYSPSQIALAAISYAANKDSQNIEKYLTDVLLKDNEDKLKNLIAAIQDIQLLVKHIDNPSPHRDLLKAVEMKLDKCRNQENNPDSQIYKRKVRELLDEEEDRSARKYARIAEQQRKAEEELLGVPK